MKTKSMTALLLAICLTGCTNGTQTEQAEQTKIIVSAAASLTDVLTEIEQNYEEMYPEHDIVFTFGGSGALQTQIEEGAPVDIFFSASTQNMDALQSQNLIDADTRINVVENKLVLIAPIGETELTGFADAVQNSNQIAIGEVESVPAGAYAKQVFTDLDIWELVTEKAIFASNVREVLTWVESGEVDCGVVYETDAKSSDNIQIIEKAAQDLDIVYPVAMVSSGTQKEQSQQFLSYLTSEESKQIFEHYGFTWVGATT